MYKYSSSLAQRRLGGTFIRPEFGPVLTEINSFSLNRYQVITWIKTDLLPVGPFDTPVKFKLKNTMIIIQGNTLTDIICKSWPFCSRLNESNRCWRLANLVSVSRMSTMIGVDSRPTFSGHTQFPVVLSLGNVSSTLADNLWDNIASHRHFPPFVNTEIWHIVVINSEGRHYYQYFPSSIKSSSIRPWRLGADRLPWCRDISLSIECRVKNMYHTPRIVQCIPYWISLSIQIH